MSKLTLNPDGTFIQTCEYSDRERLVTSGKFRIEDDRSDPGVHFEQFLDCVGVNAGHNLKPIGMSLIVEGGTKPIILLDPDLNIFYEKPELNVW